MSDMISKDDEQPIETEDVKEGTEEPDGVSVEDENNSISSDVVTEDSVPEEGKTKKKFSKVKLGIIGAIVIIVGVILAIVLIPTKLERVKDECVSICGQASYGDDYFKLDTDPNDKFSDEMRATLDRLNPDRVKNTLEAIQYANKELGFGDSVYSEMLGTTALMGRQSEENKNYKVTWSYHPDHGLEVIYSKK